MTETSTVCASCQKPKAKYKTRQSKLVPQRLLLCETCFDKKYEPRWAVIIAFRAGNDLAKEYIKKQRYIGPTIMATEIIDKERNDIVARV